MAKLRDMLEMALKKEKDIQLMYREIAKNINVERLKNLFNFLADEEIQYMEIIEKILKMKFPVEDESNEIDEKLPEIKFDQNYSLASIIDKAMEIENEFSEFYRKISDEFVDDEKRSLILYISSIKQSHYFLLQSEKVLTKRIEKYEELAKFLSGK